MGEGSSPAPGELELLEMTGYRFQGVLSLGTTGHEELPLASLQALSCKRPAQVPT